jgi:hypothetical protein
METRHRFVFRMIVTREMLLALVVAMSVFEPSLIISALRRELISLSSVRALR